MRRYYFVAYLILALAGCDSSSTSSTPASPSNDQGIFDTTVTFSVDGKAGAMVAGLPPDASNDENRPMIFSAPSAIQINAASSVQIELAYEITSSLRDFYVSQPNAGSFLQFELETDNSNATLGTVVFTVDLPDTTEGRCYDFSVADLNSLISERQNICVEPITEPGIDDERVIYFANFAASSTLSTLSLDTGEVQVIGPTSPGASETIGGYGTVNANALVGFKGLLYSADTSGRIFSIDPQTLDTELLATIPNGSSSGDLVANPTSEGLFFGTAVIAGTATDVLYEFNLNTREVTIVGETGFAEVWGLAIFRDQIVGLTNGGEFILIDGDNGRSALVSRNESLSAAGATAASDLQPVF